MKNKIVSVIIILTMAMSIGMTAMAAENSTATRSSLHSNGVIRYDQGEDSVVIDSADFFTLADRLDLFKVRVTKQLGVMHTYLTKTGGGIPLTSAEGVFAVHNKPSEGEEADPLNLDFAAILEGIAVSQSIPTDLASYGMPSSTTLYKTPEGRLVTSFSEGAEAISIQAATADNLSAGTAAWVNGKLLLGTGGDTADLVEGSTETPDAGDGKQMVQQEIAAGYTAAENIETAVAYTANIDSGGNNAAADPSLTVEGGGTYGKLRSWNYGRNGFNVKIALYYLRNIPQGAVIKGSNGVLFY